MTKEKKIFQPLESENICRIYKVLKDQGQINFDLTDNAKNVIDSLVANINGKNFGRDRYEAFEEKAVAYLYFIAKNHPFTDGNKRTAILAFEVVCEINDLNPNYKDISLDEIAVDVERFKTENHQEYIKDMALFLFGSK